MSLEIYVVVVRNPTSPDSPWVTDAIDEYTDEGGGLSQEEMLAKAQDQNKGCECVLATILVPDDFMEKCFARHSTTGKIKE